MNKTIQFDTGRLEASNGRIRLFIADQVRREIPLSQLGSAAVIERISFRHPRLGLAFALVLLFSSAWFIVTKYLNAPGALLIRGLGLATLFAGVFGAWALYELVSAPRVVSVRLETNEGPVDLALPGANRLEVDEFLAELRRASGRW